MKKTIQSIVSIILVLGILLSTTTAVSAETGTEQYISDLRLIYADSYAEAEEILSETAFADYRILDRNLNANSGEIGVWLAYQTTTNVDEAITDLAVMQMNGGYSEANYRELIKRRREEYLLMGEVYLEAIEYFIEAYDAGSFLAESAYRQLNFYVGLDHYESETLGELFLSDTLTASDLATLFLQGNEYVLKNIRSLLAMGVSYNEEGIHYLERVAISAARMDADPWVFEYEGYDELAAIIAPTIRVFGSMFAELSCCENDLDYTDDDFTELEIRYAEYKAIAEMLRTVPYLDGQSLYAFCMDYTIDTDDYSALYPLIDALNAGQAAMTLASSYYDVVRYSMTEAPEALIDEEIGKLEETYRDDPIHVYTGVDRHIYEETFAVTSAASRANAYSDGTSLSDSLFGDGSWMLKASDIASGTVDVGLAVWSINRASGLAPTFSAAESTAKAVTRYINIIRQITNAIGGQAVNYGPFIDSYVKKYTFYDLVYDTLYHYDKDLLDPDWTFEKLYACFKHEVLAGGMTRSEEAKLLLKMIVGEVDSLKAAAVQKPPVETKTFLNLGPRFTTLFYFLDSAILFSSALALGTKVYDYYHPTYDDVPTAMVDLVHTENGDAYVKYNVTLEAKKETDGAYAAGDLNAFCGQRWNALYYTKDCEAGKPLLADFSVSGESNRADEGYLAVHHFGESVCYDLNRYNFSSASDSIFLSVAQSENQKSAVREIPDVVGSIFGTGMWFIAGGVGAVIGVGVTLGTRLLLKKKKKRKTKNEDQ